jgi:hypothetical protein
MKWKNRFQKFAFKCNLHRYNVEARDMQRDLSFEQPKVGLVQAESSLPIA